MLHREDAEGLIVISQPAHAWISGQLARHWGRGEFHKPSEEVCLAAEQHDIGFLAWEQNPTLNPVTGLPHTFLELPTQAHLEIWKQGIRQMLRFGRYPALLVSLHFTGLAKRSEAEDGPEDKERFLEEQDELQTTLTTSLENDYHYAPLLTEEVIRRDRELVSLWDWMSLLLCFGCREEKLPNVPAGNGAAEIKMTPLGEEGRQVSVQPWPFIPDQLRLVCEGRRLLQTYKEEKAMREALRAAAPVTLLFDLVPG